MNKELIAAITACEIEKERLKSWEKYTISGARLIDLYDSMSNLCKLVEDKNIIISELEEKLKNQKPVTKIVYRGIRK